MRICKKCGKSEFSNSGECRECNRLAVAKYREKIKANGRPERICAKCGTTFTSLGCKPCKAAKNAAYHKANPDKEKARRAAYYIANAEKERVANAKRYMENPEKYRAAAIAWHKANPLSSVRSNLNRRIRKREIGGKISKGIIAKLLKLQKGLCPCCKQPLGKDYHLDHIMPLARGGANADENMQLLKATCNLQKNAKHPVDFMQSRGFLL